MADAPVSTPASAAAPAADANVTPANTNPATAVAEGANQVAEQASPSADKTAKKAPSPQEVKEAIKKWKLKSQGKEREITNEAELVRLAQMGLGAHEKFEQAAKARKQAESLIELLQKDPSKALTSMGMDVRKLAEDFLVEEAKKLQMTPEQRQKHEIEQEIQRLKAEKDQLVKEQEEQRISTLQAKYEVDIQDDIIKAIDQYKLPKNPKTVARIAEYMANALENGYEASALDVATRVRQDLEEEHKALYSHFSVEDLLKLIGDQKAKEIRQYEVNKVKAKAPIAPTKTESVPTPNKTEDEKPKKKMSMDDFRESLDKYLK
jgi:hypothetical protein